jgi:hypothetical protein
MTFTITSRGRAIGITDFGLRHAGGRFRMGWFHPNAEGEKVMPVIAAVLPALVERAREVGHTPESKQIAHRRFDTTAFADLAEALRHSESLDLQIRAESGAIVPTETLGIQDTHQLIELARRQAASYSGEADETPPWSGDPELATESAEGIDDLSEITESVFDAAQWKLEDDAEWPRYQVVATLVDERSMP